MNAETKGTTKQNRSIVLCMTPLHVLTVNAISNIFGKKFDFGLFVTTRLDEKAEFYVSRMRRFCGDVRVVVVPNDAEYGSFKYLKIVMRRRKFVSSLRRLGDFTNCLLPSSLSHYVYAVATVHGNTISTYDDGILNILPNTPILFRDRSLSSKILLRLGGISYWPSKLISKTVRHYSLYEAPNAYGPTTKVQLLQSDVASPVHNKEAPKGERFRILLGPAPEAGQDVLGMLIEASKQLCFDEILPHPRNASFSLDGVRTNSGPLIAEDYIAALIETRQCCAVELYGFESSALLNLANCPGVTTVSLLPRSRENSAMRNLMSRCGVRLYWSEN